MSQPVIEKFHARQAHVAVIGLGYVGLPLAVAFADAGYQVTGIDLDRRKVDAINRGESYIEDVPSERLQQLVGAAAKQREAVFQSPHPPVPQSSNHPPTGSLRATTDYGVLAECDAVSICVPTPLNKTGDPDISYIVAASQAIAEYLHPGMVVVLESTTYPGTTREVVLPILTGQADRERSAQSPDHPATLSPGQDFYLAFSPERVDPGRKDWTTRNTPKVIGGITPACLEAAVAYYSPAIETLVPVSSPEAAEMVKLFENTFRAVNIALANELQLMCDKLGLDAWEILEAAATKPFGFMKFTPGPGLGGHCIPIDPQYLSWKLRTMQYNARFIQLASEINTEMPRYWVQKVQDALNDAGKPVKGSRILILGVAYKKDVDDLRESPALDIMHLLSQKGAAVQYHDPHVPTVHHEGLQLHSVPDLETALAEADCTVIVTDHSAYDWALVARTARLVVDARNVLRRMG
ncbi:MAG: UDP-N-acetyl-D-glucosamine dehydrogenase [Litorilinea sp.]|nr:MAG: UDP-N-acetyl-D-glucosamine dehydrogenase [Litorilinea sp.]